MFDRQIARIASTGTEVRGVCWNADTDNITVAIVEPNSQGRKVMDIELSVSGNVLYFTNALYR